MSKSLSDRIAASTIGSSVKRQQGAKNLAVILSMRSEIETALADGWSLRTIWRQLSEEEKFPGDYQAFRRAWIRTTKDVCSDETKQVISVPVQPKKVFPTNAGEIRSFSFDNLKKK